MSTGTEVIKDGLRRIGANSEAQPATPEDIVQGMHTLNDMLQMWQSQGIQLAIVPLQDPGDELSEPAGTRNAIVDNLAILSAPDYDNGVVVVSATLALNAKSGYNWVKTQYQRFSRSRKVVSSTMPLGQGQRRLGWGARIFAGRNYKID